MVVQDGIGARIRAMLGAHGAGPTDCALPFEWAGSVLRKDEFRHKRPKSHSRPTRRHAVDVARNVASECLCGLNTLPAH